MAGLRVSAAPSKMKRAPGPRVDAVDIMDWVDENTEGSFVVG
jgi:hypothetical protein